MMFMLGGRIEVAFWRYIAGLQMHPLNWKFLFIQYGGGKYLVVGPITFELQDMEWLPPEPKVDTEVPHG
jgi:hypothetical protein